MAYSMSSGRDMIAVSSNYCRVKSRRISNFDYGLKLCGRTSPPPTAIRWLRSFPSQDFEQVDPQLFEVPHTSGPAEQTCGDMFLRPTLELRSHLSDLIAQPSVYIHSNSHNVDITAPWICWCCFGVCFFDPGYW